MKDIVYHQAIESDIPAIARIRAAYSASEAYWAERISHYHKGILNPQKALPPRIIFVAEYKGKIIAFIAGHLSTRLDCEGELQWIDTLEKHRGKGIATALVRILAKWFVEQGAHRICVDPGNPLARKFYERNGAVSLDEHWMYWGDISSMLA